MRRAAVHHGCRVAGFGPHDGNRTPLRRTWGAGDGDKRLVCIAHLSKQLAPDNVDGCRAALGRLGIQLEQRPAGTRAWTHADRNAAGINPKSERVRQPSKRKIERTVVRRLAFDLSLLGIELENRAAGTQNRTVRPLARGMDLPVDGTSCRAALRLLLKPAGLASKVELGLECFGKGSEGFGSNADRLGLGIALLDERGEVLDRSLNLNEHVGMREGAGEGQRVARKSRGPPSPSRKWWSDESRARMRSALL